MKRKKLSFAIAATIAAAVVAYVATVSMATKVTPAAKAVTATLAANPGARFLFDNANSKNNVNCKKSTVKMKTPAEGANKENTNRKGTGKHSLSSGSVLIEVTEAPSFTDCKLYELQKDGVTYKEVEAATVTASTKNGAWSAVGLGVGNDKVGLFGLTMPKEGLTIQYGAKTKVLSPKAATTIYGSLGNQNHTIELDGQVEVAEGGVAEPRLQLEIDTYGADENLEIKD